MMDSKTRGKMQALLAGLEFQNARDSPNMNKIDHDIKGFIEKLNKYMSCAGSLARDYQNSNCTINQLKSELSLNQSVLEEQKEKIESLQKERDRVKVLEGMLEESKGAVEQALSENKSNKAAIEELTDSLQQRDATIQSINQRLSDKESNVETLQNTVRQHVAKCEQVESELEKERERSADLQARVEELKSEHLQQMADLRVQMGEKVLRAQARITQQAGTSSSSALSSNELREIFKKKLSNTEAIHQKEVLELKKTISRLQQQLRAK